MQKITDDPTSPLKYVTEDGRTIGQFYNSYDKKYHLAEYVPYRVLPSKYLCGGSGNFSASKSDFPNQNRCEKCFEILSLEKD